MKLDKYGYAELDPTLMIEFLLFCLELHQMESKQDLAEAYDGKMIDIQGNRTLVPKLAQASPEVEENTNENVRAFRVDEDDWSFKVDSWSAVKMVKPERNFQLGLLAKVVSREKNIEPVPVISYRHRIKNND